MDSKLVALTINGVNVEALAEPRLTLADYIRDKLGLTGTKLGCEHGVCGACTVLLNGEAVRSCLLFAVQADGADVTTVEGFSHNGTLHALQKAFADQHGLQCGFCTPGFLISTYAFLRDNPAPTEDEIRVALSGNICRCTGYQGIVNSVMKAAEDNAAATDLGAGTAATPIQAEQR